LASHAANNEARPLESWHSSIIPKIWLVRNPHDAISLIEYAFVIIIISPIATPVVFAGEHAVRADAWERPHSHGCIMQGSTAQVERFDRQTVAAGGERRAAAVWRCGSQSMK
jgi:hypothetical protein